MRVRPRQTRVDRHQGQRLGGWGSDGPLVPVRERWRGLTPEFDTGADSIMEGERSLGETRELAEPKRADTEADRQTEVYAVQQLTMGRGPDSRTE